MSGWGTHKYIWESRSSGKLHCNMKNPREATEYSEELIPFIPLHYSVEFRICDPVALFNPFRYAREQDKQDLSWGSLGAKFPRNAP